MPGVYVSLDDLLALEYRGRKVSFLPRQPVHSLLSGRFASRMRGRGLNFEEIRDYRPGDDVRSIDWKVTARLQKPHMRVFNEERDRQALLVVDQRLSMFFGSRRAMKSVTAAEAAAISAWRVLGAGDRVGAIVFDDRGLTEIRPRRSRATVLQILTAIVAQNQALGVGRGLSASPSMLNKALQQAQRRALHDAAVIIISDFDGADDDDAQDGGRNGPPQRRRGAAGPRSPAKRSAGHGQHDRDGRRACRFIWKWGAKASAEASRKRRRSGSRACSPGRRNSAFPCCRSAPPRIQRSSFAACSVPCRTAAARGGGHSQMGASLG